MAADRTEGQPAATAYRRSLAELRGAVLACVERGHLQPWFGSDVVALIDLALIVKKRRARFAQKPYPAGLHPKNAEEEAMDALLEPFDA